MKKTVIVIITVICMISLSDGNVVAKSEDALTISHNEMYDNGWESWAKVRACAYYKSSGKLVTEYNNGYDWLNCSIERKVVNGYAQYRIRINSDWIPVQKSDKKEYNYCARPKNSNYIYYFNF